MPHETLATSLSLVSTVVEHDAVTHSAAAAALYPGVDYVCLTALTANYTVPAPQGPQQVALSEHPFRLVLAHSCSERPSEVMARMKYKFQFLWSSDNTATPVLVSAKKLHIAKSAPRPALPDLSVHPNVTTADSTEPATKRRRLETDAVELFLLSPGVADVLQGGKVGGVCSILLDAGVPANCSAVVFAGEDAKRSVVFDNRETPAVSPGSQIGVLLGSYEGVVLVCAGRFFETTAPQKSTAERNLEDKLRFEKKKKTLTPAESLTQALNDRGNDDGEETVLASDSDTAMVQRDVAASVVRSGEEALFNVKYFMDGELEDPRLDLFRNLKNKKCGFAEAPTAPTTTTPLVYAEGGSTLQVVLQNKRKNLVLSHLLLKPSLYAHHRAALVESASLSKGSTLPEVFLAEKSSLLRLLDYKTGGGATQVATVLKPTTVWSDCSAAGRSAKGEKPLRKVVALDGLGNAENVGAVIRSAVCFGAEAILLSKECCSPWGRRAVRVSMGHVFSVPVYHCGIDSVGDEGGPKTLEEGIAALRGEGFRTYAAVVQDHTMFMHEVKRRESEEANKWLVVMGAEHDGVSQGVRNACEDRLMIHMSEGVDSLNVSIAASILLHWFSTTL